MRRKKEIKGISNYTEVKLLHTLPVGTQIMHTREHV